MKKKVKSIIVFSAVCAVSAAAMLLLKKKPKQLNVTLLEGAVQDKFPDAEITSIKQAKENGFFLVELTFQNKQYEALEIGRAHV